MQRRAEEAETREAFITNLRERGNLAMRRGDLSAANAFYMEAIAVPNVTDAQRAKLFGNRAACLLAMGQLPLALSDARQAVEIEPSWAKGWYRLGRTQREMGDAGGAAASLAKAAELDPDSEEISTMLREVRAAGAAAAEKPAAAGARGGFAEEKARADGHFMESRHAEAAAGYTRLIDDLASDLADLEPNLADLESDYPPEFRPPSPATEPGLGELSEEAAAAAARLCTLYSNRAACSLALERHDECVDDTTRALGLHAAGRLLPARTELKVRMRREEALRRLGREAEAEAELGRINAIAID